MTSTNQSTSTLQPTIRGGRRVQLAIILGALASFAPLSLDMYLPALPEIAQDMDASTSWTQLSLTSCLLGLAVGQLVAGPLSDVRGRKGPLLIGLLLYTIASILCAYAPTMGSFIGLRFLQGLAGAAGIVIARAVVRDLYSGTEMTKFYALLMLVNGVAPIFAPIFGGQLLKVTPWTGVFLVLSAIGALLLLSVIRGLPETLPPERRSPSGLKQTLITFRGLLSDRQFMGYALSQGLVLAAMFAYISGSPFVLQDIFGVSPQLFSLLFGINGLGIILASQAAGRLAGKVSERKLLAVGLAMSSVGSVLVFIALLLGGGLWGVLPPLFVAISSVGIVTTAAFTLAMQSQEKSAGSASSLIGLMSFIIGGAVAPLVGLGGEGTALPMGIVMACCGLGAVLSFVLLARK